MDELLSAACAVAIAEDSDCNPESNKNGDSIIESHRFSKGRYLYYNDYSILQSPRRLYGQEGRIYKNKIPYGESVYYLCIRNCAVDWDGWHFGDALIPVALDVERNKIDIVKTCDKDYLDSFGDYLIFPLTLDLDLSNCEVTEFFVNEDGVRKFKERCWFRDVAFDYEEDETCIHSFAIDHTIPYAEHHPEFTEIDVEFKEITHDITWAGMVEKYEEPSDAQASKYIKYYKV